MKDYSSEYVVPNFQMTRELILESIEAEKNAAIMYEELARLSRRKHERGQLLSIAAEERKHEGLFVDMYKMLFRTGPVGVEPKMEQIENYIHGLEHALMDETMTIAPYRVILRGLPNMRVYQDMMYEIITDEQKHADKLVYMILESIR